MPATILKVKGGYEVKTPNQVHAKKTTKKKAKKQQRLLNALEHDPNFKPRKTILMESKNASPKRK